MLTYVIRRLLHALVVVLLVSVLVFLVIRMLPGDPIEMLVARGDTQEYSQERVEQLRHELGMDRPLPVQYFDWLFKVVRGNLGQSILYNYDVGKEIGNRIPTTMYLGIISFVIGLFLGPLLGVLSAVRRGKLLDTMVTFVANIGITAPVFWVGILLIYYFGLHLKWLPIYGYTPPNVDLGKNILQSIMPVAVMALFPIASAARQTRSSVIEILVTDYIRTAWAKGLSEKTIVIKHVLKNALLPVVTLQGTLLRNIIGGSIIVETVFVIPGMGKLMMDGMLSHDYTVVQGVILVISIAVVIFNLLIDLVYGWLDPRIQYE